MSLLLYSESHTDWTTTRVSPHTHVTKIVEHTDPRSGRVFTEELKNTLDVDPCMVEVLPIVVRAVLAHARTRQHEGQRSVVDWEELAKRVIETHPFLRARGPESIKNGRLLSELTAPGSALKRMIQSRYIAAWRTGKLPWTTTFAGNIGALADRLEVLKTSSTGLITARGWVDCPVPSEGWDVTDAEWDELERLLRPVSPMAGRPPSGWQSVVNEATWVDGGRQYRAQWKNDRIEVHHRPESMALTERGTPAGWPRTKEATARLTAAGTINGRAFCDQLAEQLESLAVDLAGRVVPLTRRVPLETASSGRLKVLHKQLTDAEQKIRKYEISSEGARDRSNEGRGERDESKVAAAEKDIARYGLLLDRAIEERDSVQALIDAEPVTEESTIADTATADFSTLELVAAGLRVDWSEHGGPRSTALPEALAVATRALHRNRYRFTEDGLCMEWSMEISLTLRDGSEATSTIRGSLPNRIVRTKTRAALPHFDAHRDPFVWARHYLLEGVSYEELGRKLGIDGSGKSNSRLVMQLKEWLAGRTGDSRHAPRIDSPHLRRVALDIPIRETSAIIFRHIAGERQDPNVDPAFVAHIVHTYFDDADAWWPECWTPHDWKLSRAVMSRLQVADPNVGVPVADLMRELGASYHDIIGLAGPGVAKRAGALRRPPMFTANFARVPRVAFDDRRLRPRLLCDNPACPARGGGVGGKAVKARVVVASHILWVPEIPTGALCPHCRTMPGQPQIVFPASYLQEFRRSSRVEHGTRSSTVLAA